MGMLQVDGAGHQIYYEHYRGTGIPVVLIHGWAMSCRPWDNVTRALVEAGHEVVCFDQRGCGRSDKDFEDVSVAASVSDVVTLLDALGIKGAVLNGWSLGGAIAVAAAAELASKCRGLILTCGATPRYEQAADFPFGVPQGGVAATVGAFNESRFAFLHQLAQGVCARDPGEGVVDWLAAIFKESGPLVGVTIGELGTIDQRDTMKSLTVPILNIIGGKDVIADPQVGREANALQRHGSLVEFDECGHAPFLEDFPRYRDEVLQFLARLT